MNNKPKFTPGEWNVEETGKCQPALGREIVAGIRKIADIRIYNDEDEMNAKLCAAAPDLYEALEEFIKESECYCADNVAVKSPCAYCKGRAALKKARGEA